jgi:hypothetical protein
MQLLFVSLERPGTPGQPVEAGTKYIVTKWYRERAFG